MRKVTNILQNKYLIASALFVVWMLFFDAKDWMLISARKEKLKELQQSEATLAKEINSTRTELNMLRNNVAGVEKYAREKYYMKRDNEDVYLVEPEKTTALKQ